MRLFVGTLLSASTQHSCDLLIKDLVHHHRQSLRGIPERSAHITYTFYADANDWAVDAILAAVKQTADTHHAFEIALAAPHVVSAGRRPRLVCAQILSGDEASRLTADLLTRLQRACPDVPMSPSRAPHVTLARFRKHARRADAEAVSRSLTSGSGLSVATRDKISCVQLVASTLTPDGPVYEIRAEVPLRENRKPY